MSHQLLLDAGTSSAQPLNLVFALLLWALHFQSWSHSFINSLTSPSGHQPAGTARRAGLYLTTLCVTSRSVGIHEKLMEGMTG